MADKMAANVVQGGGFMPRLSYYAGLIWRHKWSFLSVYLVGTLIIMALAMVQGWIFTSIPGPSDPDERASFMILFGWGQRASYTLVAYAYISGFLCFLLAAGGLKSLSIWASCKSVVSRPFLLLTAAVSMTALRWGWNQLLVKLEIQDQLAYTILSLAHQVAVTAVLTLLAFAVLTKASIAQLPALGRTIFSEHPFRLLFVFSALEMLEMVLGYLTKSIMVFERSFASVALQGLVGVSAEIVSTVAMITVIAACIGHLTAASVWREGEVAEIFE